jgi:DNA-binding XRE family transcriptional regulator
MIPVPRPHHLPVRQHVALPHRRTACPAWLVAAGMVRLGLWIRQARVGAGMTQWQLARLAGVSQSTISRLERGRLEGLALFRLVAIIAVLDNALRGQLPSPIGW